MIEKIEQHNEIEQLNENELLAKEILKEMEKKYPLGGLNRKDVLEQLSPEVKKTQLELACKLRDEYLKKQPDLMVIYNCYNKIKGGFCGELAQYTQVEASIISPEKKVEIVELDDHQLDVIDRDEHSNPDDITTWGEKAVLIDSWAKTSYKALNFFAVRNSTKSIPYYRDPLELKCLNEEHYLKGTPKIK